jgi:hypothetical protein
MFVFVLNTSWYWSLQYLYSYHWIQFMNLDIFILISLACDVVGPSVNTLRAQDWFFLSEPNFCYLFELIVTKSIQKSISSAHLSSENSEINSIKFDLPWAFQQHQECLKIPIKFSVLIYLMFIEKKWFNNNSFHTIAPNSLKLSWCTPLHWEIFEDIKSMAWSTMVWEISAWQTKQDKIDRL